MLIRGLPYPRLISSIDAKSGEGLRLLKDILPPQITYPRKFDILVWMRHIILLHLLQASMPLRVKRTKLIRMVSPHFRTVFLSATPHNGYQESFTSLLELLDDQRFAKTIMPDDKQLQRVMVRRLKVTL